MIITTTPNVEGRQVREYLGVASSEIVYGMNFVKDFFANVRDIVGGRSETMEKAVAKGKREALDELSQRASRMGADAVIGVSIDYEPLKGGGMLLITATGTAVTLR